MGFFNKIFGGGQADRAEALRALEQIERLVERESPIEAMEFIASLGDRYSSMVGPSGPLHARFIACIFKLKAKV